MAPPPPKPKLWVFTRVQGKKEEGEMDVKVAFRKGNNARSAADEEAATAGQGVTPIQSSPPHSHAASSRIRPPRRGGGGCTRRGPPSSDLVQGIAGDPPRDAHVHRRLAAHAAEGERPTTPANAARRRDDAAHSA